MLNDISHDAKELVFIMGSFAIMFVFLMGTIVYITRDRDREICAYDGPNSKTPYCLAVAERIKPKENK